jgi:hypothetical protein
LKRHERLAGDESTTRPGGLTAKRLDHQTPDRLASNTTANWFA